MRASTSAVLAFRGLQPWLRSTSSTPTTSLTTDNGALTASSGFSSLLSFGTSVTQTTSISTDSSTSSASLSDFVTSSSSASFETITVAPTLSSSVSSSAASSTSTTSINWITTPSETEEQIFADRVSAVIPLITEWISSRLEDTDTKALISNLHDGKRHAHEITHDLPEGDRRCEGEDTASIWNLPGCFTSTASTVDDDVGNPMHELTDDAANQVKNFLRHLHQSIEDIPNVTDPEDSESTPTPSRQRSATQSSLSSTSIESHTESSSSASSSSATSSSQSTSSSTCATTTTAQDEWVTCSPTLTGSQTLTSWICQTSTQVISGCSVTGTTTTTSLTLSSSSRFLCAQTDCPACMGDSTPEIVIPLTTAPPTTSDSGTGTLSIPSTIESTFALTETAAPAQRTAPTTLPFSITNDTDYNATEKFSNLNDWWAHEVKHRGMCAAEGLRGIMAMQIASAFVLGLLQAIAKSADAFEYRWGKKFCKNKTKRAWILFVIKAIIFVLTFSITTIDTGGQLWQFGCGNSVKELLVCKIFLVIASIITKWPLIPGDWVKMRQALCKWNEAERSDRLEQFQRDFAILMESGLAHLPRAPPPSPPPSPPQPASYELRVAVRELYAHIRGRNVVRDEEALARLPRPPNSSPPRPIQDATAHCELGWETCFECSQLRDWQMHMTKLAAENRQRWSQSRSEWNMTHKRLGKQRMIEETSESS